MLNRLVAWFRRKREERAAALMLERRIVVRFNDEGIAATYPDGRIETPPGFMSDE